MLNMKKDMAGAATMMAVASMVMAANLPVRLRPAGAGGREQRVGQRLPAARRGADAQGHHGRDRHTDAEEG